MNPTTQPEGPVTSDSLQPLREVGSMDKTQFWDMDEVMEALRVANRRGLSLKDLRRGTTSPAEPMRRAC
ncbi:MAG: hypothetical protein DVB22_002227 [Verrucomicrobia bacterium]|nr:MAG: hypothetical protein DVB22_002227 [Verrucomicrobiota bacterium]